MASAAVSARTSTVVRAAALVAAALVAAALVALSACSAPGAAAPPESPGTTAVRSEPAPLDFSATTLTGTQLDVSTLEGQPVVLWFWASWCTICRAEAPDVALAAAELEGDVTFLGVPGRGPEADMQQFVDDTATGGIAHLVDSDGSLWRRFGVVSQPAYAFVGADGSVQVFAGALGGEQLRQRAESLVDG